MADNPGMAPSTPPPDTATQAPHGGGSRGRILVVDDDRLVLATVVRGLEDAGYEVIDADNGDDAILLAREHRPQLALLDIRMAGKSGFDVAATLRDAKYGIPFMFLSAFADAATQRQVHELGALDYLVKPLEVGQIVPRVDAALARLAAGDRTPVAAVAAVADAPAARAGQIPPPAASAAQPRLQPAPVAPAAAGDGAGEAAGEAAGETAGETATDACADTDADNPSNQSLALAVGVLMHRHAMTRQAAWRHLCKLAADHGATPLAQAERLLAAVEELARSAP